MFKLIRYLKDYKKEAIIAPIFKLLEASFELLVPLVMASIIDTGIGNGNSVYVYQMCGVLIFLAVIGLASSITSQYFSAKAASGFGTKLRDDIFSHILTFSHAEIDILGKDTLLTRLTNDTTQVQNGVNMIFRLVLRSPFLVIGALIMAFTISHEAALIFLLLIVLLSIVIALIMKKTVGLYKNVQKSLDRVLGKTTENLSGLRVIRAFGVEDREVKEYECATDTLFGEQVHVGMISEMLNPLTYVLVNLGIVVILQTGAISVHIGGLTQGEVVALVNYMSQILVELVKVANLIILLSKASACAKRLSAIFSIQNSILDGDKVLDLETANTNPILTFSHVYFRYPNAGADALSDISFNLNKGETLGVIGATGCGKSTLINLIPRFYDATSGEVLLAGENIKDFLVKSVRDNIGIVEQTTKLFKGSIFSNLAWGKSDANERDMLEALSLAQASDVLTSKEGGLEAQVEALGKNFSGGQKQRISIARTLVKKPAILILDDSSSALDYATDKRLRQALSTLDTSVIIVSQRVSSIRHTNRILVLDDGKMVGFDTHENLFKSNTIYREICHSQLSEKELGA